MPRRGCRETVRSKDRNKKETTHPNNTLMDLKAVEGIGATGRRRKRESRWADQNV